MGYALIRPAVSDEHRGQTASCIDYWGDAAFADAAIDGARRSAEWKGNADAMLAKFGPVCIDRNRDAGFPQCAHDRIVEAVADNGQIGERRDVTDERRKGGVDHHAFEKRAQRELVS